MQWTEEQDATLRRLKAEGFSYEAIAERLACSARAVNRRSWRLGLKAIRPGTTNRWTEERTQELKHLWEERVLSASQIARRLGLDTRSAVIGKLNRLGLRRPDAVVSELKSTGPKHQRALERQARKFAQTSGVGSDATEIKPDLSDPPISECVSLVDLKLGQCRWPVGSLFCARPTSQRGFGSYCEGHHRRSVQPAPKRKSGHFIIGRPLSPHAAKAPHGLRRRPSIQPAE